MRSGVSRAVLVSGAFLLLGQGRFGEAQDWRGTGRIEGSVTDEAGQPIPGVTLKAACAERGGATTLTTDKKGHWVLGGVVACNWAFDIEAAGYEPKQIAIRLPAESARLAPVKVPLKKASGGAPPELRAAAEKADAAYQAGRFAEARAEYEKLLALRPDLAPTIHQQVGFTYVTRPWRSSRRCSRPSPATRRSARSPCRRHSRAAWWTRHARSSPVSTSRSSRAPTSSSTWA
jgi:hypothetical protein